MFETPSAATLISLVIAAVVFTASLGREAPRSDAVIEAQLGPVILSLGEPDRAANLTTAACFSSGCPLLALRSRLFSAAPLKTAPGETGRVQHLSPIVLERRGLPAEGTYQLLCEQGRVSKAASAEGCEQNWTTQTDT